ncbi:MAG: permease-like cell division protein FtsX [Tannerella sp.]|jgi:cell division transport system permease protein|nr:permease-like cell division protein FtsX [Tannerella sp.]
MTKHKKTSSVSFFNSNLITIISIALVLFLIGIFLIAGLMGRELSVFMKENLAFSIILKDNLKDSDIRQTQRELNAMPFVKSTKYISKEEAAREMANELGEDPQAFLGFNPFLASIEVKLKSEYTHTDSIKKIERRLTESSNVSQLLYQQDMMHLVNNNIRQIVVVLTVMIIILVLISFALISNTIRLLIYSRRFLIYTMRLVGATPAFIRKPFVKYSIINGLMAAVVAIIMLVATLYYLRRGLVGLEQIINRFELAMVAVALLAVGVLISTIAASFSVNRYLGMERGKLYHI